MGLFDKLFSKSTPTIDESVLQTLVRLGKVGLALNSGGDGGSIGFVSKGNAIVFICLGRTTFFSYRDELGIGEETLLCKQGGNCPISEWEFFCTSMMNTMINGEDFKMSVPIPINNGSTKQYLSILQHRFSEAYPGLPITRETNQLSIIVPGRNNENATYR